MIEIIGDFFTECKRNRYDAIVCTTNQIVTARGELVMGAGIALAFRDEIPGLAREWGARASCEMAIQYPKKYPDQVIFTRAADFDIYYTDWLVALPTKQHYHNDSPMELVVNSCKKLKIIVSALDLEKILMTQPGCGCGGLNWTDVKEQISFLDDRFCVINR